MRTLAIVIVALIPCVGWALQLNFITPSTNNSTVSWVSWTNGNPLRYTFYWTPRTNTDTGTNWATTTNWTQFADANSSRTSMSMRSVPTNTYITGVITVVGGCKTVPALSNGIPYLYWKYPGVSITNQPSSP